MTKTKKATLAVAKIDAVDVSFTDLPEETNLETTEQQTPEQEELKPALTAQELLTAELERLQSRYELAKKRTALVTVQNGLIEFLDNLTTELEENDEFEDNRASILFSYGFNKKITITNSHVMSELVQFICDKMQGKIEAVENELILTA